MVLLALFLTVSHFSFIGTVSADESEDTPEERPMGSSFYEAFDGHDQERWSMAGVWTNGDMFNTTWYPEQVTFEDGYMLLTLDHDEEASETGIPYKSGELRTNDFYHYGLYEVSMKPVKSEGTVSSFFTYTGEWDWDNDPWDEIDIEFLGKDTTRIQFNYFTDGVGGNEYYHDLGFDASESFNTYAFDWREDAITWYVNGEAVHTATENIPQTPQKIMMNLWPGVGVDDWTGAFDDEDIPLVAEYDWVRFTPLSELDEEPVTDPVEEDENDEDPVIDEDLAEEIDQDEGESPVTNLDDDEEQDEDEVVATTSDDDEDQSGSGEANATNEEGERLPDTATNMYTMLLIGLSLLIAGASYFVMVYRRQSMH